MQRERKFSVFLKISQAVAARYHGFPSDVTQRRHGVPSGRRRQARQDEKVSVTAGGQDGPDVVNVQSNS